MRPGRAFDEYDKDTAVVPMSPQHLRKLAAKQLRTGQINDWPTPLDPSRRPYDPLAFLRR